MSEIVALEEDISQSPLYSEDLAPVPESERTWNTLNLAALWVGIAVCIPTYLLASYMIRSGLDWTEALTIIFLANLIVTLPLALNGHAGTRYGVPFPVLGRASFGTVGVHIPAIIRAMVACGWFGIQTWIGGLAIHAIGCTLLGIDVSPALTPGKFIGFGLFWLMNIYFIWQGTESIRWLETLAAPILLLIGLVLIVWGSLQGGGFASVLAQNDQLGRSTAVIDGSQLRLSPLTDISGHLKADQYRVGRSADLEDVPWRVLGTDQLSQSLDSSIPGRREGDAIFVQFSSGDVSSSVVEAIVPAPVTPRWKTWLFWLTAMVGFWATMSISIADITRYAQSQRKQIVGQLLGLPGTMLMYSFVGVFVTCAALVGFSDVLITDDAPWDPVSLLARFENPVVVIVAQFFMIIATLSTNIPANVIAPANAFANAMPRKLNFRLGGLITGLIGIVIMPWWLLDHISGLLIFVSGLLGPVLGVMLADYFLVRHCRLSLPDLFKTDGIYSYRNGFNPSAIYALVFGIALALSGYFIDALQLLYILSWFTGCISSMILYTLLMAREPRTG